MTKPFTPGVTVVGVPGKVLVRPDAELRAADAADAETDGENHRQCVEFDAVCFSVRGSSQVFLDNCISEQLAFLQNVVYVKADVLLGGVKKFGELRLVQPNGAGIGIKGNLAPAVVGRVEDEPGGRRI